MTSQHEMYFTPEQAAQQINVHVETIRRLIRQRVIKNAIKVGLGPKSHWRILLSAWEEFLQGAARNAPDGIVVTNTPEEGTIL